MTISIARSKRIAWLAYLGFASWALPFAAFLIKPANYSFISPARPPIAGEVALRVAHYPSLR